MPKIRLILAGVFGGFALCVSAGSLLVNGSFDTQPTVNKRPVGWASQLDGIYWQGSCAVVPMTNADFVYSSTAASEGHFYIRKIMYKGQAPTTSTYASAYYNVAGLPGGTRSLKLNLESMAYCQIEDVGKFETYGSVIFYSGTNGTGAVLGNNRTARLFAQSTSTNWQWQTLTGTFSIPDGTQSYNVKACVGVKNTISNNVTGVRFDGFNLRAVPLANGSFEIQPPDKISSVGWTPLDGVLWMGLCDIPAGTNAVYKLSSTAAAGDGDYFIRRNLYSGTDVSTQVYWSAAYEISNLPSWVTSLQLDVQSAAVSPASETGKFETYTGIEFYNNTNGTGIILSTCETSRLLGQKTNLNWRTLTTGQVVIPTNAKSYKVGAFVAVNQEIASNTVTGARFDDFVLTTFPEETLPQDSSGTMFAVLGKGYNLDFLNGSNGWSGVDGSYWQIVAAARSGDRALQRVLYAGTAARVLPWELRYSEDLPVEAGKIWLIEGYVYMGIWDTAVRTALRLQYFDRTGQPIRTFTTLPRPTPLNPHFKNYSRIAGTNQVPAGAVNAKLSVLVFVDAPVTATRYVRFDDLWAGDFNKALAESVASCHTAPKPAPIHLDSESAGPVTQGILNLGKFYKTSRPPAGDFADRFTNKWTDGTVLTDGECPTNGSFVKEQYVGWLDETPVTIVFDLGRTQGLETVRVCSIYNTASNFALPKEIRIRTRADRNDSWVDWKTITSVTPEAEGSQVIADSGILTQALEVEVTLLPNPESSDNTMLISEIELAGAIKNSWREVPSDGVYHGAYPPNYGFDTALLGGREDAMRLDLFEWMVGKPLAMVLWYQGMGPGRNFGEIQEFRQRYLSENFYGNRIMTFGWLPTEAVPLTDIAEGRYDDFFEQYFLDSIDPVVLMGNDDPVWFRPMNEFNSGWVPYGWNPEAFRKAWRRIYNIAEKIGAAQKHLFVWGPNHLSYPDEDWNKMEKYWPGDQYVDWVGISCYPPSTNVISIESNRYPIARFKEVYSKYGHYKPLMVTEGAFVDGVDKVRWVDEWFQLPNVYPNVRAYIWENHMDRAIQSNDAALILYREKVQNAKWISTIYEE